MLFSGDDLFLVEVVNGVGGEEDEKDGDIDDGSEVLFCPAGQVAEPLCELVCFELVSMFGFHIVLRLCIAKVSMFVTIVARTRGVILA